MRMSVHLVLPACVALWLLADPAAADGMRGSAWGESLDAAVTSEASDPVLRGSALLVHHDRFADIAMTINRRFDDDGLWQIRYFNRELHADPEPYITDYEAVRDYLSSVWGHPEIDEKRWRNPQLRGQPEHYGKAVAAGQLVYFTGWRTEQAQIYMTLRAEQFRVAHHVVFTDPEVEQDGSAVQDGT